MPLAVVHVNHIILLILLQELVSMAALLDSIIIVLLHYVMNVCMIAFRVTIVILVMNVLHLILGMLLHLLASEIQHVRVDIIIQV